MKISAALLALLTLGFSAFAQSPSPAPAAGTPPPPACKEPEFRQFDFWMGEWTVKTPDGKEAGQSKITRVAGDCALREEWSGKGGNDGTSLNYFEQKTGKWHQDWVGGDGSILHLSGGLEGKAMVMREESESQGGKSWNEISWTPQPDGKVRQVWKVSSDGKTWKTIFDGIYEKRG